MPTNKIDPINTFPVQQFIQTVKGADASRAKEVRLDIDSAKRLAFTLGEGWTHYHHGVSAPTETKYIITGWCCY